MLTWCVWKKHHYQAKINLYPCNQKNAILFVELYRKDGVFDEVYHFKWTGPFRTRAPVVLQEIAKQVGFIQRSSKYQANELIALCVWLSQEIASTSFIQLCSQLEVSTGVLMSSEGLNQRFNPEAVFQ